MEKLYRYFWPEKPEGPREIKIGPTALQEAKQFREENGGRSPKPEFPDNALRTAKYTFWDFIPRSFCGQFRRMGNQFFLLQSVVMAIGDYTNLYPSPLASWSMIATLLFVVGLSMVFEARDDIRRWRKDKKTNDAQASRIIAKNEEKEDSRTVEKKQRVAEFQVGDLVIVRSGEAFPADIVLLTSSSVDGAAYVETANIDGETNLKLRTSVKELSDSLQGNELGDLKHAMNACCMRDITLKADAPNASVNAFNGTFESGGKAYSLSPRQFLHRGSVLKNTTWIIGIVVYTGKQTKIILNSSDPPLKRSSIDIILDNILIIVIIALLILVTATDIGYVIWSESFITFKDDLGYYSTWYLIPKGESAEGFIFPNWLGYWLSYFILFNNFVPINIYVTMDVCNLLQGVFINNDLEIYDEDTDTNANCRASNLCQELGMIEHIFSDKTGTLTQNVMKLKMIAVGKKMYGNMETNKFETKAIKEDMKEEGKDGDVAIFFVILAVAHTVITDMEGQYQAESPDEAALVHAAAEAGYKFTKRSGDSVYIEVNGESKPRVYRVHAVNTFNSKRKRMSVVVEQSDGKILLLIKGADNMIFERADAKTDKKMHDQHLSNFSKKGLRTLLAGMREISKEEFKKWKVQYDTASQTVGENRKKLLAEAAEAIERDLRVVGVTAIEDKLQDGVSDTITNLYKAGIKLWVLTGDKVETAINIGFSSGVLSEDMRILKLAESKPEEVNLRLENFVRQLRKPKGKNQDEADTKELKEKMEYSETSTNTVKLRGGELFTQRTSSRLALVLHGKSLEHIMSNPTLKAMLLELSLACKVVVACRVSPLQKAEIVDMVREGVKPEPVTLAIGDGANDVTMIQRAHVGVGISGNEGQQAANVSDFSISQFRYLQRLLLVHGRWNYRRICKVITYTFYKNFCITLTLLYFAASAGFSGTSLYDSWVYTSYNIYTMLPICAVGCLDQDVRSKTVEMFPALYLTGRLGLDLNPRIIFQYILLGIVHSLIVVFWPYFSYFGLDQVGLGGLWVWGTLIFSCLVFTVQYRVMLITITWTEVTAYTLTISFLMFFLFLLVYGVWYSLSWEFYFVPYQMFESAIYWVLLFGVPATALYFDFVVMWISREFFPTVSDFAMEVDYMLNKERKDELMSKIINEVQNQLEGATEMEQKYVENLRDIELKELEAAGTDANEHKGFAFSYPADIQERVHRRMATKYFTTEDDTKQTISSSEEKKVPEAKSEEIKLQTLSEKSPDMALRVREEEKLQKNRPLDESTWRGRFLQQKLPRLQKPLTPCATVAILLSVGFTFILVGSFVFVGSQQARYQMIQYEGSSSAYRQFGYSVSSQDCSLPATRNQTSRTCNVTFNIEEDMDSPVYLHYGLSGFYQNYQTYQADKDYRQLDGSSASATSYCSYYTSNDDGETILPCGLEANSMFNDTYTILSPSSLSMSQTDIAWKVDREKRFNNPSGFPGICSDSFQCLSETYPDIISESDGVKSERFMIWMRTAALSTFMKRYGRIDTDLKKGDEIVVQIKAQFVVEPFEGSKAIILTTDSWIGGRNTFLAVVMLLMGALVTTTGLGMLIWELIYPRQLGTKDLLIGAALRKNAQRADDYKTKETPLAPVELP